jgi:hypothetical protein
MRHCAVAVDEPFAAGHVSRCSLQPSVLLFIQGRVSRLHVQSVSLRKIQVGLEGEIQNTFQLKDMCYILAGIGL